uniref:Putative thrombospondin type-1 domain-containing protein 7a isoform x2 n=1 Tax=Ixodes ricinus TaxID=34613 RepID=A0A147BC09_IXORI
MERGSRLAFRSVPRSLGRALLLLALVLLDRNDPCHGLRQRAKHRGHRWVAGPWSTCVTEDNCSQGWRMRTVRCVDIGGEQSTERHCRHRTKPPSFDSCYSGCDQRQHLLRWQVGEWSPCEHVNARPHLRSQCRPDVPETGLARRNVSCVFQPAVGPSRAVDSAACLHLPQPSSELRCAIPCPQDCVVSPFEAWPPCHAICQNHTVSRRRTVLVGPLNGGNDCPALSETMSCPPRQGCRSWHKRKSRRKAPGDKVFVLSVGPWSECQSDEAPQESDSETPTAFRQPVVGVRRRKVICLDHTGVAVDVLKCRRDENMRALPTDEEGCVVPVNCQVSPWSQWHVEREGCLLDSGELSPSGPRRQRRFRTIQQLPWGGASPCPPLVETALQSQHLPLCSSFDWITSEWSSCVRQGSNLCNGGVRQRNVTCIRTNDSRPVAGHLCEMQPRPPLLEECTVPCPVDCLVSEWSPWGQCLPLIRGAPFPAPEEGYRVRSRTVEVHPSSGGKECPHLKETESCDRAVLSHWEPEPWNVCQPLSGASCGVGVQSRSARCLFFDGTKVDDAHCIIYESPLLKERECFVPCPDDCVLSEWSPWSPCTLPCAEKMAYGVQSRNRSIIGYPTKGGKSCPQKSELKEVDDCNLVSCFGFRWNTGPWRRCVPQNTNSTCGKGKQSRTVSCFYKGNVSDKKCAPLKKPPASQPCHVPCPVDCKLTNFSDWRLCRDCGDGDPVLIRERFVVQSASSGGKPCPWQSLRQVRLCRPESEPWCLALRRSPEDTYSWNTSAWSQCILPPEKHCGVGYQVRNITCTDSNQLPVEPGLCVNMSGFASGSPFFPVFTVPEVHRKCFVSCSTLCAESEWSEWSPCPDDCRNIVSYRRRDLISSHTSKCDLLLREDQREERSCPVKQRLEVKNAQWSECIFLDTNATFCGKGLKYKMASVTSAACSVTGIQSASCEEPCPKDCVMNDWSPWSPCDAVCGMGKRTRSRSVRHWPQNGGRPCPISDHRLEETQTDACMVDCGRNMWLPSGWTRCRHPTSNKRLPCGEFGVRSRSVLCMSVLNGEPRQELDQDNCDPLSKPSVSEECTVHCAGQCVVSEWSDWSKCLDSKAENSTHLRNRTRRILRQPRLGDQCPYHLTETDACLEYNWVIEGLGSCIPKYGASCGEGLSKTLLYCIRKADNLRVDYKYCDKNSKPGKETLVKTCRVPCPIDCHLSEWSDWDTSECDSCGTFGDQVRQRQIIQNSSDAGRPCPSSLVQRKPCPFKPCYYWTIGGWSQCDLHGADCGFGTRKRVVTCQRSDGTVVDDQFCHLVNFTSSVTAILGLDWLTIGNDVRTVEDCYVKCPHGCSLFPWSEWSACNRNCDSGEILGLQTRSRGLIVDGKPGNRPFCPTEMLQSRPCWNGVCLTFAWKVVSGALKCFRSDGVVVEGGCRGRPRPCVPGCPVGARCDRGSGQCSCVPGTVPVFAPSAPSDTSSGGGATSTTLLSRCEPLRAAGMDSAHADNHTAAGAGDILLKYYPDDNEASFWMYAMISVGSAFVIFVAVTVYLMCQSSVRQRLKSTYSFSSRHRSNSSATSAASTLVRSNVCCAYEPAPTSSSTAASTTHLY